MRVIAARSSRILTLGLLIGVSLLNLNAYGSHFINQCEASFQKELVAALPDTQKAVFGAASTNLRKAVPNSFRLISWNIHKGDNPAFVDDFKRMTQKASLALFQEMVKSPVVEPPLSRAKADFQWQMALAFDWDYFGGPTGVATGSDIQPLRSRALISPVTEPVSNTPKSALLTEYALEGRTETLLVVNVHAINFVFQSTFESHMKQVAHSIKSHVGPLIVAGDFNTWSWDRYYFLKDLLGQVGLSRLEVPHPDERPLDHIFVRGLTMTKAFDLRRVHSSDHIPLVVDLMY